MCNLLREYLARNITHISVTATCAQSAIELELTGHHDAPGDEYHHHMMVAKEGHESIPPYSESSHVVMVLEGTIER